MKKIIRIDASAIKDSACFRRLYLTSIEGYRGRGLSNDIHYGSCFHKCVETYDLTGDKIGAIIAAQKLWRERESELLIKDTKKFLTLTHLTMACQRYMDAVEASDGIFQDVDVLRSPTDNKALVEVKMSIPLYEDDKLIVLLQGTIDKLVKIRNGCIAIADWKTTASYDIEEYFSRYSMSPQLKTYYYGLTYFRDNYPNSPIGQLLKNQWQIGAFIYGAFLSAKQIVQFQKSNLYFFSKEIMDDYEWQLKILVQRIVTEYETFPRADGAFNGSCVSATGYKCPYFNSCSLERTGGKALVYHHLNSNFLKKEYRPLEFGGGQTKTTQQKDNEKDTACISTP